MLNKDVIFHISGAIDPQAADALLYIYNEAPIVEAEIDGNKINVSDEHSKIPNRVETINEFGGKKILCTIPKDSPEFGFIVDIIEDWFPPHPDFEKVNFMQIIEYQEESFFPFHKDIADSKDTATALFALNGEYGGGNLQVEENVFNIKNGDMVAFNNSTKRFHGVSPISWGNRFVLAIWFGREEEETEPNENDMIQEMLQYYPKLKTTIKE